MRVAINGFGRIGRSVFKAALERKINIVAINAVHGPQDAAYLLEHDSVYGPYNKKVQLRGKDLLVNKKKIKILAEREISKLPWKKLKIDVVIESTGAFRAPKDAKKHLKAGAKYVLITAPAKNGKPDLTIVPGVNSDKLKKEHKIISVASCTTNCLAPLVKVLNDNFGVEKGFMTTVHAYTSSQSLVDNSANKPTRGRAAAQNIVPTTTGATDAVTEVLPEMKGKLDGMALRVPVVDGSITDFVAKLSKKANTNQVNKAFEKAAKTNMKSVLAYNTAPLVSTDIIGNPSSAIFNAKDTKVNGDLVKVLAWYDNEYGYSCRVVDVIKMLKKWAG